MRGAILYTGQCHRAEAAEGQKEPFSHSHHWKDEHLLSTRPHKFQEFSHLFGAHDKSILQVEKTKVREMKFSSKSVCRRVSM